MPPLPSFVTLSDRRESKGLFGKERFLDSLRSLGMTKRTLR